VIVCGLSSDDTPFRRACLHAITNISSAENEQLMDRIILEGAFSRLNTLLFANDILVLKNTLFTLSNLVTTERHVQGYFSLEQLVEKTLTLMRN